MKLSTGIFVGAVVAGLGWGASVAFDDGLKGCDVDGDGIVYTISDDNEVSARPRGVYNFDENECFSSGRDVVLPRIKAVNYVGTPLPGFTRK